MSDEGEFDVVTPDEFQTISLHLSLLILFVYRILFDLIAEKEEVEDEKYLVLDTLAPFWALFPLCSQKELLMERSILRRDGLMKQEMAAVTSHIAEICSSYGNYKDADVFINVFHRPILTL